VNKFFIIALCALMSSQYSRCCDDGSVKNDVSTWLTALTPTEYMRGEIARQKVCIQLKAIVARDDTLTEKSALTKLLSDELQVLDRKIINYEGCTLDEPTEEEKIKEEKRKVILTTFKQGEQTITRFHKLLLGKE